MAAGETGYVEFEGGKVYYEVGGAGKTLVLLHASIVDSGMWDAQWDAFTQHYRVIRYDMRGYGKSDAVQQMPDHRAELNAVLEQLGVERAALIGCSMGGITMLDFALEHPEKVEALVLISAVPSGFEMEGEPPRYFMERIAALKAGDMERVSDLTIRISVDGSFREPEQVDPAVRAQTAAMNKIAVGKGAMIGVMEPPPNPLDPPAVGRLGEIRVPTLIVTGDLDDPNLHRAADVMAREIAGARKLNIPGAAHVPSMEKPELFNPAVLDFLASLDQ